MLSLDGSGGVVLAADLGAAHATLALCDLSGHPLAEAVHEVRLADGPEPVLRWVEQRWRAMLDAAAVDAGRVLGLGIGVPGPVDAATGRVVHHTPVLPGWRDHPVRDLLEQRFGVVCVVDNDANAMALGEYHAVGPSSSPLLFVTVATGIGAGVVVDGRLLRGADGAEGDLGHVRITSADAGPLCVCGARGCLAASASGRALARALRERGEDVPDSRSAVELALTGHAEATRLVRQAGLVVGDVLATAVSLLNPRVLALGGDLVRVQDHFVGAVCERLYQRTQPQAARGLRVVASTLGDRVGIVGAARLALEEVLSAEAVDRALAGRRQPVS
ncbi:Sugar kinase of the NBD/HSP70 family, may contain an N-terminal HTH domain [Geodermatophilus siccatus]|uniref:Sugar kinase of the NBD/HSP70 family, may contain an N-terminal HTH domain n=1 Tax=Geodermatophilus siccatus TaxID=1137991 RepID=A0A1G9XE99_9ACTN|nr:ROK family protein [Geodermatophilus siccatus]SDM94633.1 Sugar kinase of the NBD/HSP70 family, may contain an N-terminal HTH domain [Geodermatophilus siccatus]